MNPFCHNPSAWEKKIKLFITIIFVGLPWDCGVKFVETLCDFLDNESSLRLTFPWPALSLLQFKADFHCPRKDDFQSHISLCIFAVEDFCLALHWNEQKNTIPKFSISATAISLLRQICSSHSHLMVSFYHFHVRKKPSDGNLTMITSLLLERTSL